MLLFWQKGYEATSFTDIVNATGVSRYGIYDEFDSKKGLYLAALSRYFQQMASENMAPINQPDARVSDIRAMFEGLIAMHESGEENGCMFCHAANEMANKDDDIKAFVLSCFGKIKDRFARVIQNSVEAGELADDTDIEALATVILGFMQGGAPFVRTGMPADQIRDYMHAGMKLLLNQDSKAGK